MQISSVSLGGFIAYVKNAQYIRHSSPQLENNCVVCNTNELNDKRFEINNPIQYCPAD